MSLDGAGPGVVTSVAPNLVARLNSGHPMVAAAVKSRAEELSDEHPDAWCPGNGVDATAVMVRSLSDAMLASQQLREELITQIQALREDEIPPGWQASLMHLMAVERDLIAALSASIAIHRSLWATRDDVDPVGLLRRRKR